MIVITFKFEIVIANIDKGSVHEMSFLMGLSKIQMFIPTIN